HVVFKRPFLGQSEMDAVQAVHLWRGPQGWLIAEFEELENAGVPLRLRTGLPPSAGPDSQAAAADTAIPADIFPVSPRAPDPPVEADSLRLRIRLKHGGS